MTQDYQTKQKQRNGVTDLMKFIFSLMIVLYHSKVFAKGKFFCTGGYIAVEFFFIVSGYYLAVSAAKDRKLSQNSVAIDSLNYIKKRLLRIYPYVLPASLFTLIIRAKVYHLDFTGAVTLFFRAFGEWSLLQQAGVETRILIGGTWYISAMVIASVLLYPLARWLGDKFNMIIAPAIFAIVFIVTITNFKNIQVPNEKFYGVYVGLWRGIMEMSFGCFIYGLRDKLAGLKPTPKDRRFFTMLEILLYGFVIVYYSFGKHYNRMDWLTIIILGFAVLITQTGFSYSGDVINGKLYSFLGEYSFALYLGHKVWSRVFKSIKPIVQLRYLHKMPLYLLLAAVSALLIMYTGRWIISLLNKWERKREEANA